MSEPVTRETCDFTVRLGQLKYLVCSSVTNGQYPSEKSRVSTSTENIAGKSIVIQGGLEACTRFLGNTDAEERSSSPSRGILVFTPNVITPYMMYMSRLNGVAPSTFTLRLAHGITTLLTDKSRRQLPFLPPFLEHFHGCKISFLLDIFEFTECQRAVL